MSQPAPDVDRQTLERVELALPEWAGGFEVLERNLKFDGKQLAHWLAYSQGRILLVSVVNGHSDGAVLRAMDGLSFAQNQPEMLSASLGKIEDEDALVQVVLVALEGYSKLQLERLGTLPAENIELLRRRELSTSRGTHTRMESVECSDGGRSGRPVTLPEWSLEPEFRTFLARIAPDRLQLALTVVERMRRMDPQFGWQPEGTGLACLLDGKRLARLNWEAGHMQLFFDEDRPLLAIRDNSSLELALEELLERYLDLLSGDRRRGKLAGASAAQEPSATEDLAAFSYGGDRWSKTYREPSAQRRDPEARDFGAAGISGERAAPRSKEASKAFREPGDLSADPFSEKSLGAEPSRTAKDSPQDSAKMYGGSALTREEPAIKNVAPRTPVRGSRHPSSSDEDANDLPELDDHEIQPMPPGPLLTAAEIEAFLE